MSDASHAERIAALEAKDAARDKVLSSIHEDLKRLESRIYAIVATGILASGTISALTSALH